MSSDKNQITQSQNNIINLNDTIKNIDHNELDPIMPFKVSHGFFII
jgi:hypothetical protein